MSTLLLIPWIIFGYKHPYNRFIGLCQTRKSILILLSIELLYWILLVLLLAKPDPAVVGRGSFAWTYILFYEKGIIPVWVIAEHVGTSVGDAVDARYKFVYLAAALMMDYIFLLLISPRIPQFFRKRDDIKAKVPW